MKPWLTDTTGAKVHGHLFGPDRAEFAQGETIINGALSDCATLRDYNPTAFLSNLIWNTRGERQCFQFGPADTQDINWLLARDKNAQISVITGAWAIDLFRSNMNFADIRTEAARLQQIETKQTRDSDLGLDQSADAQLVPGRVHRIPDGAAAKHYRRNRNTAPAKPPDRSSDDGRPVRVWTSSCKTSRTRGCTRT